VCASLLRLLGGLFSMITNVSAFVVPQYGMYVCVRTLQFMLSCLPDKGVCVCVWACVGVYVCMYVHIVMQYAVLCVS
jgi:hypothetical protein